MKKLKTLALVMSAVCCIAGAGVTASAADINSPGITSTYQKGTLRIGSSYIMYVLDCDSITITDCDCSAKEVNIPAEINGIPVTAIDSYTFAGCFDLEKIVIPDSVVCIKKNALDDTAWYKSQPDGPVYLGNILYKYKGNVPENTTLKIKDGTAAISPYAFVSDEVKLVTESFAEPIETTGLVKVEIPDSIEYIGASAFKSCINLEEVVFPTGKSVKIEAGAFYNTEWYNSQADGLVYLGDILYKYKGIVPENSDIVLDENTKAIAAYAFNQSDGLASLHKTIELNAIDESLPKCSGLKSIELPDGLEYIGDSAFAGCTSLTQVKIPDSVTEMEGAFSGCTSLSEIEFSKNLKKIGAAMFAECSSIKNIDIPDNIVYIDTMAFYNTGLTDIVIPENVKRIEPMALYAPGLKNVTFMGEDCFIYNSSETISNKITGNENTIVYSYDGTITGQKNSIAEAYAEKYGIEFKDSLGVSSMSNAKLYYADPGDVNANGKLDLYDAIEVSKYIINTTNFDNITFKVADCNNDGMVDLYDAIDIASELISEK